MELPVDPEPDSSGSIIHVGQDAAGHWLVQQQGGGLEGRFISLATAMAFARAEQRSLPGASVVRVLAPMVPSISFAPVEPWESGHGWRVAA